MKKGELIGLSVISTWCKNCGIVNILPNTDYECPNCKAPGSSPMYFGPEVYSLLDLLENFYFEPSIPNKSKTPRPVNEIKKQDLAILIFFCSLVEVLLYHFLVVCMNKKKIPVEIQERMLNDNVTDKQRVEKLFPVLTGDKWKNAMRKITNRSKINYTETVKFYTDTAAPLRNNLLHQGDKRAIPKAIAENCIKYAQKFIYLFVELNNRYIAEVSQK